MKLKFSLLATIFCFVGAALTSHADNLVVYTPDQVANAKFETLSFVGGVLKNRSDKFGAVCIATNDEKSACNQFLIVWNQDTTPQHLNFVVDPSNHEPILTQLDQYTRARFQDQANTDFWSAARTGYKIGNGGSIPMGSDKISVPGAALGTVGLAVDIVKSPFLFISKFATESNQDLNHTFVKEFDFLFDANKKGDSKKMNQYHSFAYMTLTEPSPAQ